MGKLTKDQILYWIPRILSLMFVGFLSIFAFDVFTEYQGWSIVPALFMHLLPSIIMLFIILAAWKYDMVGAIVFIVFGIFYVFIVGLDRHWSWYASISGPTVIIGIL